MCLTIGLNARTDIISGLSLWSVLALLPRVFLLDLWFSPSKPPWHFSNSNCNLIYRQWMNNPMDVLWTFLFISLFFSSKFSTNLGSFPGFSPASTFLTASVLLFYNGRHILHQFFFYLIDFHMSYSTLHGENLRQFQNNQTTTKRRKFIK